MLKMFHNLKYPNTVSMEIEKLRVLHKLERDKSWHVDSRESDYEEIWRKSGRKFRPKNRINIVSLKD